MLTKVQKKRLAREARKLAMECVGGTAPPMITDNRWGDGDTHCALGWLEARSGLGPWSDEFREVPVEACRLVTEANNYSSAEERHASVAFPLLAFADMLEESSEQPPAGPSRDF